MFCSNSLGQCNLNQKISQSVSGRGDSSNFTLGAFLQIFHNTRNVLRDLSFEHTLVLSDPATEVVKAIW